MITSIKVNNAGLILLQSYVPTLFSHLHLTEDNRFISAEAQQRAVHYLQFLVTGHSQTADQYLTLNKILCGFKPQDTVGTGITLTAEEALLCEGMLHAFMGHWSAIGASSVEGMRGNWLVRDGALDGSSGDSADWHLKVEKRAYDVLINQCPFSFSIIKFPWMNKVLRVTWPT
ncbi:hypothetical protein H8L32_16360 [Undibacterium sp. CY18W]|uniref:Uncharacterized protein n=1 Tax=Undibacterium hunanense TaxID=2762292 RepID=A0ABR6ZT55_9BURK|nr:hypothetical protein [Undibacterium hunanense]